MLLVSKRVDLEVYDHKKHKRFNKPKIVIKMAASLLKIFYMAFLYSLMTSPAITKC
jgi:hypothetical protein